MDINKIFEISKKNRNMYRGDSVLYFFKNYDISSEAKKLGFVLEALQTVASCGQDFIRDKKGKELTDQEVSQLYSDMGTYIHNKKIVGSKLLLLATHYYNTLKNRDLISLKNVELFYKGSLKFDQIMRAEAVEFIGASGESYGFITIGSIHATTIEVMEDIALNLFDDYSQGILKEYEQYKGQGQVRRLLSNLGVIDYYTKLGDLDNVKKTKDINDKLLNSLKIKNENKKVGATD